MSQKLNSAIAVIGIDIGKTRAAQRRRASRACAAMEKAA
jgi:hypothetical protein